MVAGVYTTRSRMVVPVILLLHDERQRWQSPVCTAPFYMTRMVQPDANGLCRAKKGEDGVRSRSSSRLEVRLLPPRDMADTGTYYGLAN